MTEPSLGVLLFIPYRHVEQRVLEAVTSAGFPITMAQARVFQRVADDGSRLTQLAEAAEVTKQTAGVLVDHLEKHGYVERTPDPSDSRARLIQITSRGREVIALARTVEAEIEAEWVAHLGSSDTEQLRTILRRLRLITDPYR